MLKLLVKRVLWVSYLEGVKILFYNFLLIIKRKICLYNGEFRRTIILIGGIFCYCVFLDVMYWEGNVWDILNEKVKVILKIWGIILD